MMLFSQDRNQLRRHYLEAWRKYRERRPLEPLEALIGEVVQRHPEYQGLLENEAAALSRDYFPELGETNPFLHMGMHIALREQVAADRPAGIRALHEALARQEGDAHAAEHRMMECLAETLWQAQRTGQAPDEQAYLAALRGLLK